METKVLKFFKGWKSVREKEQDQELTTDRPHKCWDQIAPNEGCDHLEMKGLAYDDFIISKIL